MPAPDLPEPFAGELAPRPTRRWRARLFQLYLLLALLGFGLLFALASSTTYFPIDLTVTRGVQAIPGGGFSTLMRWVSYPGFAPQAYVLAALVCAGLFALRLRWEAVCAGLAAAGVSGLGLLIKLGAQRPRPSPDLVEVIEQLSSYSFPSSHVLFYTTFYGFLFFLIYTLFKASPLRALLLLVLGGLIALVGLSRIQLGQHWFSDVMAAYLLGSVCLALTVQIYRWGRERFFVRQD